MSFLSYLKLFFDDFSSATEMRDVDDDENGFATEKIESSGGKNFYRKYFCVPRGML